MRIALISDIHLDHYKDGTNRFCNEIDAFAPLHPADVMVVAGDVADGRFPDQYRKLFGKLRQYYEHVIVVTGNHDYYQSDFGRTHHSINLAAGDFSNVHFLVNSYVEIDGKTFYGGTMWYRDDPMNTSYEHWMNDVRYIPGLKTWVYDQQAFFEHVLSGKLTKGDIVVTHHMPSWQSVDKQYKTSPLNRFFVCDMEKLIVDRQPALWLHGHTHFPCDYKINDTRVLCNPKGYPRERLGTYVPKVVSL